MGDDLLCPEKTSATYLLVLLVCTPVVHAASGDPLDVRILVDASKALHESDSLGLRSQTVRSLVSQIPEDAVAGVWGYAHLTQRYAKHAKATGLWKQSLSACGTFERYGCRAEPAGCVRQCALGFN